MKKALVLVLVVALFPTVLFAQSKPKSGYELYHSLKGMDNPQSNDDLMRGIHAFGYLDGFLDSLMLLQDIHYESMFPSKMLSESEREKFAKEMNFNRLNLPNEGIAVGQFILIYKKYAEKNPGRLHGTPRACLLDSLVKEFGWK
jgi:hypothetical protein